MANNCEARKAGGRTWSEVSDHKSSEGRIVSVVLDFDRWGVGTYITISQHPQASGPNKGSIKKTNPHNPNQLK